MSETAELLKQDLVIEPDLQNFINFALECVSKLGGNIFAAAISSLTLIEKLRNAGFATGRPVSISLLLQGNKLLAQWDEQERFEILTLETLPQQEAIAQLQQYLQNSTSAADPNVLLQRNAQMERYYGEARARNEKKLQALQQALEMRQLELQQTSYQAKTDSLTGLLNRRAFDERLKQSFLHTMRQRSSPLSLLLFDLDYFKEINDKFGHQVGDEHLKNMANILRTVIREDVDIAFRFGGDEFAAVIFADSQLVSNKAKQVLKAMHNKVSIGIASINQDTQEDLTLEEFIHRADNALYEAKNRGRGQIMSYSQMSQAKLSHSKMSQAKQKLAAVHR